MVPLNRVECSTKPESTCPPALNPDVSTFGSGVHSPVLPLETAITHLHLLAMIVHNAYDASMLLGSLHVPRLAGHLPPPWVHYFLPSDLSHLASSYFALFSC